MIHSFAPAKLNLTLHITGRRADGYHNLDSLVVFAGVGDHIHLEPADHFDFVLEGPQAPLLRDEPADNNLVVKAVRSLADKVGKPLNIKLTLVKNLPVASGIGGGSSDAAAALRALAQHWNIPVDDPRVVESAVAHGQDVPVCLQIINNYITADGTEPAPELPNVGIVLVNPNQALPTPTVYKTFREGGYGFTPESRLTEVPRTVPAMIAALKARGNDLYEPARRLMPVIGDIMTAIDNTEDCLLARMSGSGATCFGLYADHAAAQKAAMALRAAHPTWWIADSTAPYRLGDS